jgi:integrase
MLKQRSDLGRIGLVFSRSNGLPLAQTWMNEQHQKVRDLLNLPEDFVAHSPRHTFGTRLGEANADAFTIMKLMGQQYSYRFTAIRPSFAGIRGVGCWSDGSDERTETE